MEYSRNSLYKFLESSKIDYQLQANFEFRYPALFNEDSFLIDQLDFPQLDKNIGYVWLDGFQIPVHSRAKFGNEIRFTMYVEDDFLSQNGKYYAIFNALLSDNYEFIKDNRDDIVDPPRYVEDSALIATIIPLKSSYKTSRNIGNTIRLYNALIKSISLDGGFSANSTTISKFTVSMTYSLFYIG